VKGFGEYVERRDGGRAARGTRKRTVVREDAGEVQSIRSQGLQAASVALPADVDLEERAARMNEFWRALVEYQHRDVVVVALCATD
jgi:hypothetical protein